MTAEQLTAMRAGREEALERKRERYTRMQADYLSWVKNESETFAVRANAIELHSRDSDEFHNANNAWHEVLAAMPSLDFVWS